MSTNYVRQRRTRIRGLPQSPSVIRSVVAPFVRGKNTERQSWQLDPQEFPDGQDFCFPKGVAVPRGPYIAASGSGVLVTAGSNWLTGGIAADLPSFGGASGQPATPLLMAAAQTGAVGIVAGSLTGSAGTVPMIGGTGIAVLPREVYKGEVLWCSQDGETPIYRFAGAPANSITVSSAGTGTVTYYQGTSFVLGTGTLFTTQARVGTYIGLGAFPGYSRMVVATDDDTHISVDGVFPITTGVPAPPTAPTPLASGMSWGSTSPSRLGVLGLCIPVQTLGQASITTGLGTTVSGFGTLWNTANTPPGQGRPRAGIDYIGIRGTYDRITGISAVTNDFTLTIGAAPVTDYANRPYLIYRPAMGRECRYHQGRLYITGVAWDDTGVYYLPVNSPLGAFSNPDTGATITSDFAVSQTLLKFDVPIAGAQGKNIALLSTPQGLLVLRSDNAYLVMGDPPTQQVIEVAHGAGCVDLRSACVGNRGEGAFWAGSNGIYRYVGGRVIDLTEGRRNREWRQKMQTFMADTVYGTTTATISCGVLDGHLFVAVYDGTTPSIGSLWVYDLSANAWCADFSGATTIGSISMYRSSALKNANDDIYFTSFGTIGTADRSQLLRMGGIARDEGGLGTTSMYGTFSADLPESVIGPPDDLSRVIEEKVVYELTGAGATMGMLSNVDGGAYGTDATLLPTTAGPQETRIMPLTDVTGPSGGALGALGRRHGHRVTSTGTKPTALRVHQIDFVVRPRRPRA